MDFASGRNRYIGHLISIPCHDFKNIKVGLDCSNGSSSAIAKSVFDALRAKTYVINNEPNGTNINRGCGSTHIEVLRQFVVDKGLDIGFAYDGDADRCIAVDHRGNIIDGDKIMYVCGKYLREKGPAQRKYSCNHRYVQSWSLQSLWSVKASTMSRLQLVTNTLPRT